MSELGEKLGGELQDLKNRVVDNVMMVRLGAKGIAIIRKRTLEGRFLTGSSPNADEYSTKPLPLPFGKFTRATQKEVLKRQLQTGEFRIFTNRKSGNTWIIIEGGYKKFRELAGKPTDNVVMTWSGRMLRNLGITRSGEQDVELGFSEAGSKQLALYHNVMGAGKSKRKHVFMGFDEKEINDLGKMRL